MPFGESLVDRVMEWVVEKVVLMALNNALSDTDSVIARLKQAAGLLVGQPKCVTSSFCHFAEFTLHHQNNVCYSECLASALCTLQ